jgi:hypothetical protein
MNRFFRHVIGGFQLPFKWRLIAMLLAVMAGSMIYVANIGGPDRLFDSGIDGIGGLLLSLAALSWLDQRWQRRLAFSQRVYRR